MINKKNWIFPMKEAFDKVNASVKSMTIVPPKDKDVPRFSILNIPSLNFPAFNSASHPAGHGSEGSG